MRKTAILFLIFSFSYGLDVTSGGVLSENQAAYDVRHYDIRLKVDPELKMISGCVDITFYVLSNIEDSYKKVIRAKKEVKKYSWDVRAKSLKSIMKECV